MRLTQVLRVGVFGLLVVLAFGLVLAEGSSGALGAGFQPLPGKGISSVASQEIAELFAVDFFGAFVKIDPAIGLGKEIGTITEALGGIWGLAVKVTKP
jgi:hypothetical protein